MAVVKLPTSFNIDVEFEVPEFYRRFVALLIDFALLFFYLKIAGYLYQAAESNLDYYNDNTRSYLLALVLILRLPIFLYFPVMEITTNGQSLGKKIMSIRVVNEKGGKPNISQFLIRWLLRDIWFVILFAFGASLYRQPGQRAEGIFLLLFVIAYFITDLLLVITSKKSQRLGDILAHTILVRTNTRASIEETVFQEVSDDYIPSYPQIMQLSDRDINAIKSILQTSIKKGDLQMAAAAAEKIKAHLQVDTHLAPFVFLEVLLKDYNYLSTK